MICQYCQEQPAQVQYTEVVGGTKRVEWLCTGCARERGINIQIQGLAMDPPPSSLPSPLPVPPTPNTEPELECTNCGLDLATFRERGRVGCAECYEVFSDALGPLLRRVHHATEHALSEGGRDARSRLGRVLDTLRRELLEIVQREEFERAASIRDEIRRYEEEARGLESGGDGSPPGSEIGKESA